MENNASPFASAFEALSHAVSDECEERQRVVGFSECSSSASEGQGHALPSACTLTERAGSLGGLGQALLVQRSAAAAEAARPKLSITTTRSLRVGRAKHVPPIIQEHAELQSAAAAAAAALGSTAPSREPLQGLHRAASSNIDMPSRWVDAAQRCRAVVGADAWGGARPFRQRSRKKECPMRCPMPAPLPALLHGALASGPPSHRRPRPIGAGCPRRRPPQTACQTP